MLADKRNEAMMRRVLALSLMTALAATTLPGATAYHNDDTPYSQSYRWSTPETFSGDLLVELSIDFGVENGCMVEYQAAVQDPAPGLIGVIMASTGWHTWYVAEEGDPLSIQAHSEAAGVDTRSVEGDDGAFVLGAGLGNTWTGVHAFTIAAFDTSAATVGSRDFPSFVLTIDCHAPFTFDRVAGSRQVTGFDTRTMQGNGASVYGVQPSPVPGLRFFIDTSINVRDGVSGTFTQDEVRLSTRGFPGLSAGEMTVQHPDGVDAYPFSGADMLYLGLPVPLDVDHRGGPGAYDVRIDRVGTSPGLCCESFWGIIGGLDVVARLDDIVG